MKKTDNQLLKNFGGNLSKLRKGKGFSLRELSSRCNVDFADISKIENGKINISLTTLIDLAFGLGVAPKKLLDFDIETG